MSKSKKYKWYKVNYVVFDPCVSHRQRSMDVKARSAYDACVFLASFFRDFYRHVLLSSGSSIYEFNEG